MLKENFQLRVPLVFQCANHSTVYLYIGLTWAAQKKTPSLAHRNYVMCTSPISHVLFFFCGSLHTCLRCKSNEPQVLALVALASVQGRYNTFMGSGTGGAVGAVAPTGYKPVGACPHTQSCSDQPPTLSFSLPPPMRQSHVEAALHRPRGTTS